MQLPIYLDYSATTPVDPRVVDAMIPWLRENFGNPASRSHSFGWTAEKAVDQAREQVAALVNCDPRELIWTSGATESINLALKGAARFYKDKGKHLVTVKTEHKATLDTMRELERDGFEVTYLDVEENGLVDFAKLEAALQARYDLGVGDVRQQRDRRHSGYRSDRRAHSLARHRVSRRRCAGDRQDRGRPRAAEGGSDVVLGAQDLRSEGRRRAVCQTQAARAARSADARRRP